MVLIYSSVRDESGALPSETWSFCSLPLALLPVSSPQRLTASATGGVSALRPTELMVLIYVP